MNIDFILYQPDKYQIYVFDYSPMFQDNIPEQVFAITLDIAGLNVPNGRIPAPIDVLAYLYSSNREDNNLYIIRSEDLGLGESQEIPDGVYEITYTINNNYSKTYKFLVYKTIKEKLDYITTITNYKVEVGSYDLEYVGDDLSKGDLEWVRFAHNLFNELESSTTINDETKVLNSLNKLQRLLILIEKEIT